MAPSEIDYDIEVLDGLVRAYFKPTESEFVFPLLADPHDIAKYGPISDVPTVRHAKTGDTGDYDPKEVAEMAFRLALKRLLEG